MCVWWQLISVFLSMSTLATTAQAMRALPSSVLDLHLDRYHLSYAGSRRMRAQRLWEHTHPDDTTGSDTTTAAVPPHTRRQHRQRTALKRRTTRSPTPPIQICDSRSHLGNPLTPPPSPAVTQEPSPLQLFIRLRARSLTLSDSAP